MHLSPRTSQTSRWSGARYRISSRGLINFVMRESAVRSQRQRYCRARREYYPQLTSFPAILELGNGITSQRGGIKTRKRCSGRALLHIPCEVVPRVNRSTAKRCSFCLSRLVPDSVPSTLRAIDGNGFRGPLFLFENQDFSLSKVAFLRGTKRCWNINNR